MVSPYGSNSIANLTRRIGIRGALIRYGERWRTAEIKAFQKDIYTLNTKHFSRLDQIDIQTDAALKKDILELFEHHGPILWPVPDASKSDDRVWLFQANDKDAPGYTTDLVFTLHRDIIEPVFIKLLMAKFHCFKSNRGPNGACHNSLTAKAELADRTSKSTKHRHSTSFSSELTELTTTAEDEVDADSVLGASVNGADPDDSDELEFPYRVPTHGMSHAGLSRVLRSALPTRYSSDRMTQKVTSHTLIKVLRIPSEHLRAIAAGEPVRPLPATMLVVPLARDPIVGRKRRISVVSRTEPRIREPSTKRSRSSRSLALETPHHSNVQGREITHETVAGAAQPSQYDLESPRPDSTSTHYPAGLFTPGVTSEISLFNGPPDRSEVENQHEQMSLQCTATFESRRFVNDTLQRVLEQHEDSKPFYEGIDDDDELIFTGVQKVEHPSTSWMNAPQYYHHITANSSQRHDSGVSMQYRRQSQGSCAVEPMTDQRTFLSSTTTSSLERPQNSATTRPHTHQSQQLDESTNQDTISPPSSTRHHSISARDQPAATPENNLHERLARTTLWLKSYNGRKSQIEPRAFASCETADEVRQTLMRYLVECMGAEIATEAKRLRVVLFKVEQDRKRVEEHVYRLPLHEEFFADGWEMVVDDLVCLPIVSGRGGFMLLVTPLRQGEE